MSKKLLAVSMVAFVGTKSVLATPMSRAEYCEYRGWHLPENEDPNEPVYLVEYTDGGKPNDERHKGYITMSPKEVFDNAYHQNGSLTFGDAVVALKGGEKVARSGWNGKGMFLEMAQYTSANEAEKHPHYHLHNIPYEGLPWIGMKTADSKFVPWLASQTDVLAEDWVILS
ncbi:DUF2829 domain-containing protein [Acinetobacter pullicarnis]|uniref:DUF2829 domain-containing protein n=1 Tax=Acinetobacter pullicarnis TaxID=2576829 RepID=UPI001C0662A9|nr:DUF2829 domain-containing protein [Acinetobacter pullicarnis]